MPLLVSRYVNIKNMHRGCIKLEACFAGMLQFGYDCAGTIDSRRDRSVIQIERGGTLVVKGRCCFGAGCNISIGGDGVFAAGQDLAVTGRSTFICHRRISIGCGCLISWDCLFMDTDFHKVRDAEGALGRCRGGG